MGRPPIPAKLRRNAQIVVRLRKSERRLLDRAAKANGETVADFVRRTALGAAAEIVE
jgi:uncharacterized protein (DUF1778 family)